MPYGLRKKGSKWQVITKPTGKVHGTHDSKKAALKQLAAIEIHTGGK